MAYGKSIHEALCGAFAIAFEILTPFFRRRRTKWGATQEELARTWPGDDLIAEPKWQATMAVTVQAPPERVWPWVAQIGQGRGGFYSYEGLENLAGCKITNATRIDDRFQAPAVGDPVRLHPEAPPLTLTTVEPGRAFVLFGGPVGPAADGRPGPDIKSSWAVLLEPDGSGTRLISRTRYYHGPGFPNAMMGGPALIEPISFVMTRKMLKVIKALVEAEEPVRHFRQR